MGNQTYIGRQPVLDRERKILGYELFCQDSLESVAATVEDSLSASAQILVSLLNNLESGWLPEGKLVFINVDIAMLLDPDFLALLPDGRIVLDIYGKPPSPRALALVGYRQLYRWVALLLYTAGSSVIPPALTLTVLTRSRFIELLGKAKLPRQEQDNLFIVGMLSMLGIILETPLENVVEKLHVPEAISQALLKHEGVYGPFLELAEACENCDAQRMTEIAAGLGLTADDVNGAHLAAISWAEALSGGAV